MKSLRKTLLPSNPRGSSPSISSTVSFSGSSAPSPPLAQSILNQPQNHQMDQHCISQSFPGSNHNYPSHEKLPLTPPAPEIVIRALEDYQAQRSTELSFKFGDLLQALAETWSAEDGTGWFEAMNPTTRARGFVPIDYFQVFASQTKGRRPSMLSHFHDASEVLSSPISHSTLPLSLKPKNPTHFSSSSSPHEYSPRSIVPIFNKQRPRVSQPIKKSQPLYGIVRHDFKAERIDELGARTGEPIILIAHSHREWFVAKPIGRLGGPGLIPVSFVEVRDLSTGKSLSLDAIQGLMNTGIIPNVEDWKKAAAAYRGNSIQLGKFETPNSSVSTTATKVPTSAMTGQPGGKMMREVSKSHQHLRSQYRQQEAPLLPTHAADSPPDNPWNIHSHSNHPTHPPSLTKSYPPFSKSSSSYHSTHKTPGGIKQEFISISTTPKTSPTHSKSLSQHSSYASADSEHGAQFATVEDLRERYGILIDASVESFHMEEGKYWFHLRAHFNRSSGSVPTGEETTVLVLYRLYDDFFDFHAGLLDAFPCEAGRESIDQANIFPKLPEPKERVDDIVCAERVNGLRNYLGQLCKLPSYIREYELFYEFLGPREGDVELKEQGSKGEKSPTGIEKPPVRLSKSQDGGVVSGVGGFEGISRTISPQDGIEQEFLDERLAEKKAPLQRQTRWSNKVRLTRSSHNLKAGSTSWQVDGETEKERVPSSSSSYSYPHVEGIKPITTSPTTTRRGQHSSNFSCSTTASFNVRPAGAAMTRSDLNPQSSLKDSTPDQNLPIKTFHRIKIYQDDTDDVIVTKIAGHGIGISELLELVAQKVRISSSSNQTSSATQRASDQGISSWVKGGKIFVPESPSCQRHEWVQLLTDKQLEKWMTAGRLVLLYSREE